MYQSNRTYSKSVRSRGWIATVAVLIILATVLVGGFFFVQNRNKDDTSSPSSAEQTPSFDKTQFSLTDPVSPWLVVNKQRQLSPKEYAPSDLRLPAMQVESEDMQINNQTAAALETLDAAAESENIGLIVASAYRSFAEQTAVYGSMVNGYGQAEADRLSARPGHSEHQTGWAVDLSASDDDTCRLEICFAGTPEGKWLAANAYKYGFIIRYPEGKESITGYSYEPWHIRYVGKALAEEMHRANVQTLEEFFDLPAASSY